jgi:hypothetical protein
MKNWNWRRIWQLYALSQKGNASTPSHLWTMDFRWAASPSVTVVYLSIGRPRAQDLA